MCFDKDFFIFFLSILINPPYLEAEDEKRYKTLLSQISPAEIQKQEASDKSRLEKKLQAADNIRQKLCKAKENLKVITRGSFSSNDKRATVFLEQD